MGKIKKEIKMRVNPEQSQKVQEICFKNDIEWYSGKILRHLDEPFLYINDDNLICYSDIYDGYFDKDENEEVSAELFIRTNGTCVESGVPTEDNNKGEQMEELKLECLVEGYEGTYFEVGQVWETRDGNIKARITKIYTGGDKRCPIICEYYNKDEDRTFDFSVDIKGNYAIYVTSKFDLVKLISTKSIPSEEPQPKTLSEYLKENNAYETFVENCVEYFLGNMNYFYRCKKDKLTATIDNIFIWEDSNEGYKYWNNLSIYKPKNLIYDMNEIVFAEVDKRIAEQKAPTEFISTEEFNQMLEQKSSTKYMVFVEGKNTPRYIHETKASAETEAKRLSTKMIGSKVSVVEIVKEFKSKVIVEEV